MTKRQLLQRRVAEAIEDAGVEAHRFAPPAKAVAVQKHVNAAIRPSRAPWYPFGRCRAPRPSGWRFAAGIGGAIGAVLLGMTVVFAFWTFTDNAHVAAALAGSIGPGQTPSVVGVSGRDVSIQWNTASNATTYNVARSNAGPQSLSTIEHGSCASSVSTTSCIDTGLPENGTTATNWTYTDTPIRDLWQGATSSATGTVSVPAPTLLLDNTSFTYGVGGTPHATVANFFDNEGVTYCLDTTTLPCTGGQVGTGTVPGAGGSVTNTITIPAGETAGPHTLYAVGSDGSVPAGVAISVAKDSTTTAVSETPTTVTYGNESASLFTVTVTTGNHEVLPATEPVTVTVGSTNCVASVAPSGNGGRGACSIGNTALSAGGTAYTVTATYPGDTDLSASTTATAPTGLTVSKDSTTTAVSETPTTVTYGNESASLFTVTVTTGNHEVLPATEPVTVTVGSTNCVASVAPSGNGGSGSCSIGNTALGASGTAYTVTATYPGDTDLSASTTATAPTGLTVSKDSTTTAVSETPTTVTYGNESASLFTVTVTTGNHEVLPATEPVTVTVGSTNCVASVAPSGNGGSGSCSIGNTALGASGTAYTVTATYPGDTDLSASTTATAPTGLTVSKDSTTTAVSETPTTVTYGNESASLFTVTVTTGNHEVLPATEAVTVNVGSTNCVASVAPSGNGGSGTCSIGNTALGASGTAYTVTATYPVDTDLSASTTATAPTGLTVNAAQIHISSLNTGTSTTSGSFWGDSVVVTVEDSGNHPVNGIVVTGTWNPTTASPSGCTTNSSGQCTITVPAGTSSFPTSQMTESWTISNLALTNYTYAGSSANTESSVTVKDGCAANTVCTTDLKTNFANGGGDKTAANSFTLTLNGTSSSPGTAPGNSTVLILVMRDSANNETITSVTGTAIANATEVKSLDGASFIPTGKNNNTDHVNIAAFQATGTGTSAGTVIVNFSGTDNNSTMVDVVVMAGNNTKSAVDQSTRSTGTSAAASATLVSPSSADGEVVLVGTGGGDNPVPPSPFVRLDNGQLDSEASVTGFDSTSAQSSASFTISNNPWGTIAVEIQRDPPQASVTFPADGAVYDAGNWNNSAAATCASADTICGLANDGGNHYGLPGASAIALTITQASTGDTWDGANFSPGSNTVHASSYDANSGTWMYTFPRANLNLADEYSVAVVATDGIGEMNAPVTSDFIYGYVPPAASLLFPTSDVNYNSVGWSSGAATACGTAHTICGEARDGGSGFGIPNAGSIAINITQVWTGDTWNGTSFTPGTNTVTATSYDSTTGAWTYSFPSANFNVAETYSVAVVATDAAGNMNIPVSSTFGYYPAPDVSITFAADGASYDASGWSTGAATACGTADTLCGQAIDGGSPILDASSISITVTQAATGDTWNGVSFAPGNNTVNASSYDPTTGLWTYGFPSTNFDAGGTYSVAVQATGEAGFSNTPITSDFTYSG